MTWSIEPVAAGFDTKHFDGGVVGEGVEHADAVGATADACDDCVWELAAEGLELGFGLVADDGLEGADDGWEGVGSDSGADDVVCGGEVNYPGAESFVDSVAEGAGAGFDRDDLGTEELHTEYIKGLAADVFL